MPPFVGGWAYRGGMDEHDLTHAEWTFIRDSVAKSVSLATWDESSVEFIGNVQRKVAYQMIATSDRLKA